MGSFNTTCFVSQQTISTDDEVLVLPIVQQTTFAPVELFFTDKKGVKEYSKFGYTSSICNTTAFWAYGGPTLTGKYDDYGQVVFDDTPKNKEHLILFLNQLHTKVLDVKEGENSSHDLPLSFSELYSPNENYSLSQLINVMDKIWEVANESRLFVRNYLGEPVNLAFSIMHKASANYLVDSVSSKTNWAGDSLEMTEYFHTYLNKKLKECLDIFSGKKETSKIIFFLASQVSGLDGFQVGSNEGNFIRNHYDFSGDNTEKIIEYFNLNPESKEIPRHLSDELFEYFKPQIEHRYIDEGLNDLSVRLSPMVYADQDYDNSLGNSYLNLVKAVNKEVNSNLKARYGDDDEESTPIKPKM